MSIKQQYYREGYYKGLVPEPRFSKVLEVFRQVRGERLLDIGCGDGAFTVLLKEAMGAKEVFGIEIASDAVASAEKKGVKTLQVDIDENVFPFEDDYFDAIYCGEVIEHLFDPDHLLDELNRVLKPEGICVLTTPNLAGWPNRIALLLGFQPYPMAVSPRLEGAGKLLIKGNEGQWGHVRVFTLRASRELAEFHHLKVEQTIGCPVTVNTPSRLSLLIRAIDRLMARLPSLSTRIIMVIRKQGEKR